MTKKDMLLVDYALQRNSFILNINKLGMLFQVQKLTDIDNDGADNFDDFNEADSNNKMEQDNNDNEEKNEVENV